MESVWKLFVICFWKSNCLDAHDEGDCAKDKDGEDGVNRAEVADVGGRHGAKPCHGAREGEGGGSDDGGEELVGVGVHDAPAHLAHVLARHGQHHDGPLVQEPAQGDRGRGHAQQTTDYVVSSQVWAAAKPERELVIISQ